MTQHEHTSQRDRVRASLQLAETPEERHGVYSERRLSAIPGGTVTPEQIGRSVSGIGMLIAAAATHPDHTDEIRCTEYRRLLAHLRGQTDALESCLRCKSC